MSAKKIAARKQVSDLLDYNDKNYDGDWELVTFCLYPYADKEVRFHIDSYREHIATIELRKEDSEHYNVAYSKAISGYGPLMYDWAMEYVTDKGFSLGCDVVTSVSPAAQKVWDYYLHNRPDVEAISLFKWGTYKDFLYSLRKLSYFGSIEKILETCNKSYLITEYPTLFSNIQFGLSNSKLNLFWEEFNRFKENADDHKFFEWVENKGVFYTYKKRNQSIRKQIRAGIDEGWFQATGELD